MRLKTLDKLGLMLIFLFGGFFGFTDRYGPKDVGTFLGSATVILLLSIGIGWILFQFIKLVRPVNARVSAIKQKVFPSILFGTCFSLIILLYGLYEYFIFD